MIEFREKYGLTQEDLSQLINLSVSKISKYERGLYTLSKEEKAQFDKIKQYTLDQLNQLLEEKKNTSEAKIVKYRKKNHCIYHGDTIDVLKKHIVDNSIDLIFVDPPYNIGKRFEKNLWETENEYLNWCYTWIDLLLDKLKDNGSMYLMAATQFMPYFDLYLRDKMTILSRIVWYYDSSGRQAKNYFGSLYEPILHMVKSENDYTFNSEKIMVKAKTGAERNLIDYRKDPPEPYNSEKVPGNVWKIPRVRYRMNEYEKHPSQKPEKLLKRIIMASSNVGDIILDPFAGTFTASAVAKKLKRKTLGIEIEESYIKIGLRRLNIRDSYKGKALEPPRKSY